MVHGSYTVTHKVDWPLCDINVKHKPPDYRPTNHRQLVSWWTICDFSSSWKIRAEGSSKMVLQYFRFSIAQEKWSPQNGIRLQEHKPLQVKTNYCFHSIYLSVQLSLFCGGPVGSTFSPGDGSSQPISMSVRLRRRSAELIALHLASGGPMHLRQSF